MANIISSYSLYKLDYLTKLDYITFIDFYLL